MKPQRITTIALAALIVAGCASRPSSSTATAHEDTAMSNEDTVRKFLNGFNDPSKIQESLDLLADDYRFKNPMVELHSKAEFIPLAQNIGAVLTGVELTRTAAHGEWVAAFYIFKSEIPGVQVNHATEWFRLEDGMIKESHLIYDASAWRKVYADMQTE